MDVYTNQSSSSIFINFPDDNTLACGRNQIEEMQLPLKPTKPPIGENNIFTKYSILEKGGTAKKLIISFLY